MVPQQSGSRPFLLHSGSRAATPGSPVSASTACAPTRAVPPANVREVRLLWVVPRFGAGLVGGAEMLVRGLATRALPDEWRSEIATTCATNHFTWANELPPGTAEEDGVTVHRFPVGGRDGARYKNLHPRILSGEASYAEELEWLANSVWSPEL